MQGIIHNITILKKSEKAALQTEKLNAAQRLLRSLAHEVRNPVNNIYLALEQLVPSIVDEDPKEMIEIIDRNSRRISALITELLDTSRPIEIQLEKIPLQQVMDESIVAALDRITLKKIKLVVNYTGTSAWVMADKTQLKIAFLNIIINAIEAMKEDEGELQIEIRKEAFKYMVIIGDNGNGISEENLTKLFEPYFTSKQNGMGLGLASTLNIIKAHKAMIEVQSNENVGTNFYISFDQLL
jgi:signal transduction histidine kinase